ALRENGRSRNNVGVDGKSDRVEEGSKIIRRFRRFTQIGNAKGFSEPCNHRRRNGSASRAGIRISRSRLSMCFSPGIRRGKNSVPSGGPSSGAIQRQTA